MFPNPRVRLLMLCAVMFTLVVSSGCEQAVFPIFQTEDQLSVAIDAACKIRRSEGQNAIVGTGTVFDTSGSTVKVLTAGHVCPNEGETVYAEFYFRGYGSGFLPGRVTWVSYIGGPPRDCAVVEFDRGLFGGIIPTAIPIAPEGSVLPDGATIFSTGCPKAAWPNSFRGHIVRQDDAVMALTPEPLSGRSGSGLLDETGRYICGIICWAAPNTGEGYAVSLNELHRALRGEPAGRTSIINCAVKEASTGREVAARRYASVSDQANRYQYQPGTQMTVTPFAKPYNSTGSQQAWPSLQCPGGQCPSGPPTQPDTPRWRNNPQDQQNGWRGRPNSPLDLLSWPPRSWEQWLVYAVVAYLAYRFITRKPS